MESGKFSAMDLCKGAKFTANIGGTEQTLTICHGEDEVWTTSEGITIDKITGVMSEGEFVSVRPSGLITASSNSGAPTDKQLKKLGLWVHEDI